MFSAIDIWSAGVIMISIMSGSYPFFRAPDDTAALMEIITVFGTETVMNTARRLGRSVLTNETFKPLNLRKLCERLRQRSKEEKRVGDSPKMIKCPSCRCTNISQKGCLCSDYLTNQPEYPESAYDLLKKLLSIDPKDRFTAEQALEHPFFNN